MAKGKGESRSIKPHMRPAETAAYIAQMSAELAGLARKDDLTMLAFLLDMASHEAQQRIIDPSKPNEAV